MMGLVNYLKRKRTLFLLNHIYNESKNYKKKNKLLRRIGVIVDDTSRVSGPIHNSAKLVIGKNCWIGRNFNVEGNGEVIIEDNCDIAPNVTILTGTHHIGTQLRRASDGFNTKCVIKSGSWICANTIICPNVTIGSGNIVAAGSVVVKSTPDNVMICGVPAQVKKKMNDENDG